MSSKTVNKPTKTPKTKDQKELQNWIIVGSVFIAITAVLIIAVVFLAVYVSWFGNWLSRAFSTTNSCNANPSWCQYTDVDYAPGTLTNTFSNTIGLFCAQNLLNLEQSITDNSTTFKILPPLVLVGTITIPNDSQPNFGYVALDPDAHVLYIVYRGTQSSEEWSFDFMIQQQQANFLAGQFVNTLTHVGFSTIFNDIKANLLQLINTQANNYYAIVVTGHSLGGAICNLTCAYLVNDLQQGNVYGYTFGAPRVIIYENLIFC
jgi:hypothetical protein